ncbi:polyketide synthase [Variovorax ginsengisoli]|uniref:Amino acid adenylation domain-containing protein n=1 Tax=Variovorax ginsengisoli TaxID=363844 RepID=A0ABT8SAV9_9BURK|nr:polyketide synthase [Variovorax ginsengisoli]MDN8616773.1 amino acid adenylation domain-containing protein [Variovorax ginsengisoli]MDO1535943.1 amino acid adenylation domain-containing protein [Variovorax ginsengisoli]
MTTFVPLHQRVAALAATQPGTVAVSDGSESISYEQLNRRANQLARRLQRAGAGRDQLIAIGMERSVDMVVGLLAILKSGGAYLPIDLDYPMDRIEFTLDDARPVAVLTSSASAAAWPKTDVPVVLIDDETLADEETGDIGGADPEALAYVIYTSGSTGRPKGCLVTHANVARLFDATDAWYGFGADDVWTFFHSHAFDFSVWEIWGALVYGGRVVVVPYTITRSPAELLDLLVRERVTVLNQTPSAFRSLIEADRRAALPPEALALRYVIFGGEALSFETLRPWFDRHGDARPQLVNMYGITETTVHVSWRPIAREDLEARRGSMIGRAIPDLRIDILDAELRPVAAGETGEIVVSGAGVSNGYLRRPELTAERFIDWTDPASGQTLRAYRSGDLGRRGEDGDIECLGRIDHQVKIRGFRIETDEIETLLLRHAEVRECAVIARTDTPDGEARLVAYVVPKAQPLPMAELRALLAKDLPQFMLPSAFVELAALPITENGKLDRRALPAPPRQRPELASVYREPAGRLETRVCQVFAEVLDLDRAGALDNFFELGGTSLAVLRVMRELEGAGSRRLAANDFFQDPTPRALALALGEPQPETGVTAAAPLVAPPAAALEPVAIIAMAGRFPGAADVEQFWDNLRAGRDTVRFFDDATLDPSVGAALRSDPAYVRARGVVDGIEMFDAAHFGISPKEAEVMDPQQRLFLELCWECLERGGYAPDSTPGPVGVFAGMYGNSYFQHHLLSRPDLIEQLGELPVALANDKDFIATRVAHRLNLTGPAISVHTACSTSLVAIAQAFSALRNGDCDMALAGGAAVTCPPNSGYLYQEGAMLSPDGHTRSFDAKAQGTVFSDGAAVVLLKRLSAALADGDPIHAVLRGAAVNNDGGVKASFTAPSIDGQARVVTAALASAGVDARSISYVETHGTATPMGDPIEIAALAKAYGAHTADTGFCGVGSVKSNIGHLVAAAGATGLIKTTLALREQVIPASLHFESPNPAIAFDATPFRVVDRLQSWPRGATPRRAGVSSFGVGGTNAHVVVEEAPPAAAAETGSGPQLLQLSARTPTALAAATARLADHLAAHPDASLADVAHTLRVGRKAFAHRACVVAETAAQAVEALRTDDPSSRASGEIAAWVPQAVFLFPGQGAQYAGMGQALHAGEPVFRAAFDECLQAFEGVLSFDLRERMFSDDDAALKPTSVTQPATFALEYALARQLQSLGVRPAALIGHSVGEFAAAVLAGVMQLGDAARLVARRGALMQSMPEGDMLSVRMPADELSAQLPEGISLAAENGPNACVAAGPAALIEQFRQRLEAAGVAAKLLQTSHAFHSQMMEGAVAPFEALVREVRLAAPTTPIYSTLTGRLLSDAEAIDPAYWARHLRETVRFAPAALAALAQTEHPLFIELGPRNTLTTLVRQHASRQRPVTAVALLADAPARECTSWRLAAGRLWTLGLDIDPGRLDTRTRKQRLELPTYPFERKRFWVDIATPAVAGAAAAAPAFSVSSSPSIPESTMTVADPAASAPPARRASLSARLRDLFEELSGITMADAAGASPFVEIGLDSLTLTQAALQVKKQFKVNLTFRQLMESYRSFDALAEFLDANLPPDPVAAVASMSPAPALPVTAAPQPVAAWPQATALALPEAGLAIGAGMTLVQQVIAQQMQLMQQQLALLSAAPPLPASPGLPAATVEQPTPMATAAATASTSPAAAGTIARVEPQNREPTERQKPRLAAFMRRYTERTAGSKAFAERNPQVAGLRMINDFRPETREIVYPIVVERSKGSRLWDLDGNEYIDAYNGGGMNLFGWQPDFMLDALRTQLDNGFESGTLHPLAAEVTQRLCELTAFDRASLFDNGAEAVTVAIRMARTVTGRRQVAVLAGVSPAGFDDMLALDFGKSETLDYLRAHAADLAAVLVEPAQNGQPGPQPREFLREVRAITETSGTCLVFDETITGFRSHLGGVQAMFGVQADLACYGGVIGGGLPIGAVAGRRAFMDVLDNEAWAQSGIVSARGHSAQHPLALAATRTALELLKQDDNKLQTKLNLHTAAMADELSAYCREVGAPLEILYFSSLWRVNWLEDHPQQDLLFAMMRSRGVHVLEDSPCFMTGAHTQEDIATIKSAFKESLSEMQDSEFLPRRAVAKSSYVDPNQPPVPNARLGRDRDGQPAWFVPNPAAQGKYIRLQK